MSRIIIILLVCVLVEFYALQAIRRLFKSRKAVTVYIACTALIIFYFIYSFSTFNRAEGQTQNSLMMMAFLLLYSLTKVTIMVILLVEDIYRLGWYLRYRFLPSRKKEVVFTQSRRKFISQIALGIAAIPFFSILYGIFEGKYNFKVFKHGLYFEDLPENFDGFKILQISDIHCGSFDNKEKIEYAIDLINQQEFDVLVFTGDLVNNFASEMDNWISVFRCIKTPKYGKYSILGNHDYGEYTIWDSKEEKQKNFEAIKGLHEKIGFKLLLNENVILRKSGQKRTQFVFG